MNAFTLGDEDLGRLYITTTPEGVEPGEDPLAGSLFQVRPGVRRRPVREFGR